MLKWKEGAIHRIWITPNTHPHLLDDELKGTLMGELKQKGKKYMTSYNVK